MYHLYKTESIVLKTRNSGESGKKLTLLTKELGRIEAYAEGARKITSKTRFALTDGSRSEIGIIRGNAGWRVTYASPIENFYGYFSDDKKARRAICGIFFLCDKLTDESSENDGFFEEVLNSASFLKETPDVNIAEKIAVAKILHLLGYLKRTPETEMFMKEDIRSKYVFERTNKDKRKITKEINNALNTNHI